MQLYAFDTRSEPQRTGTLCDSTDTWIDGANKTYTRITR